MEVNLELLQGLPIHGELTDAFDAFPLLGQSHRPVEELQHLFGTRRVEFLPPHGVGKGLERLLKRRYLGLKAVVRVVNGLSDCIGIDLEPTHHHLERRGLQRAGKVVSRGWSVSQARDFLENLESHTAVQTIVDLIIGWVPLALGEGAGVNYWHRRASSCFTKALKATQSSSLLTSG